MPAPHERPEHSGATQPEVQTREPIQGPIFHVPERSSSLPIGTGTEKLTWTDPGSGVGPTLEVEWPDSSKLTQESTTLAENRQACPSTTEAHKHSLTGVSNSQTRRSIYPPSPRQGFMRHPDQVRGMPGKSPRGSM